MPKYQVYLEIDKDGYCAAHIPELLGFYTFSESPEKTLEKLTIEIKKHLNWLKKIGEKTKSGKIEYEIKEIQLGTCPRISGNKAALFTFDFFPPTNQEIKIWLKRAEGNRKELKEIVYKLPKEVLDWKEKNKRSIREVLNHIANCDWWYVSRLNKKLPENSPKEIFARLDWARKIAVNALLNLTEKEKSGIFVPTRYCGTTKGENWTARKVFRRFLEHEREHIENIKGILKRYRKFTKSGELQSKRK
jgi:predicted RNase H-like HicB family nuclease